jgi:DNA-binding GntR family transcriptional regulator
VLKRLHTLSQLYVRMHLRPIGRIRRAAREHNGLYEVWAEGDARRAARLTTQHIEETRAELAEFLDPGATGG